MVLSSDSDSEVPNYGGDEQDVAASGVVFAEANAVPIGQRGHAEAVDKGKDLCDVWWPERVTNAVKASADFGEYKKKRIFTFAHFFSGKEDVLGAAIKRLAGLDGMTVKTYSFDQDGADAVERLKEQPYMDILDNCRKGELDAAHAGPPLLWVFQHCSTPTRQTPPARNPEHITGFQRITQSSRRRRTTDRFWPLDPHTS